MTRGIGIESLPQPSTDDGRERLVGVEIEFGGLDEARAARIVREALGGTIRTAGPRELIVDGTEMGDMKVVLDTSWRKHTDRLTTAALDVLTGIVPVEIVTPPIAPADIAGVDALCRRLRGAGATGSRAGLLLGFGLHLNPMVAAETVAHILPVARAYAFLEDHLRDENPPETSRRILPFVDPYPRAWLDALATPEAEGWSIGAMIDAYLATTPSRNRGLDLLPLFRHLDEARVLHVMGEDAELVSARPTYHFRLPDCRIDEDDWSVAAEWNRWVGIERVAAAPGLTERLAQAWRAYRDSWTTTPADWRRISACIAAEAG